MKRVREEEEEKIAVPFLIPELRAIIRGFLGLVARIQFTRTCWEHYNEGVNAITPPLLVLHTPIKCHRLKQFRRAMREWLVLEEEQHPLYFWLHEGILKDQIRPIYKGTHIKDECIVKYVISRPCSNVNPRWICHYRAWHRAILSRPTPTTWRLFMYACLECCIDGGCGAGITLNCSSLDELWDSDYQESTHVLLGFPAPREDADDDKEEEKQGATLDVPLKDDAVVVLNHSPLGSSQ
jgi:hypothetical protein